VTDFKAIREQTIKELEAKLQERRELDKKILGLRQAIRGLDAYQQAELDRYRLDPLPLPPEFEGIKKMGLTAAVSLILEKSIEPLTAKQIRDRLESFDYRKIPKGNPMAAIHGVLTRLERAKRISQVETDGKKAFNWNSPFDRFLNEMDSYTLGTGTKVTGTALHFLGDDKD